VLFRSSLVEADGFAVREGSSGLVAGPEEVLEGPGLVLRLREVVGKDLVVLDEPVHVQLLDRQPDQPVELLPALDEERVVRHFVGERVLEHVGELGKQGLLVDELDGL